VTSATFKHSFPKVAVHKEGTDLGGAEKVAGSKCGETSRSRRKEKGGQSKPLRHRKDNNREYQCVI